MTKWSPAWGMYEGRSFDEQNDIMERCSILFNPADFCRVIFSGVSQQTWQIKKSCFKGGGSMFNSVLCCLEQQWSALVIASDENTLRLFFLGICEALLFLGAHSFSSSSHFLSPTAKS